MMKILLSLLLFIIGINLSKSQDDPNQIVLSATIVDQSPIRNPDFEIQDYHNGLVPGIVLPDLGASEVPTYCCGNNPVLADNKIVVHNSTTFNSWFNSVPGVNIPIAYELILSKVGDSEYQYQSSAFFPIDGRGFDNTTLYPSEPHYQNHNFHFCMKIHYYFTYHGGEYFSFTGDDDVWVFFNDKLEIDIGGIHTAQSKTIYMDDLGLTIGERYPCERHTSQSNLNIFTNLNFSCISYDACGVCEGDNSTCCAVNECFDYASHCVINDCGPDTNYQCHYHLLQCDDNNECTYDSCSPLFGCVSYPISCSDGDHCTEDYCDDTFGCIHVPIPNCQSCSVGNCISTDLCLRSECNPSSSGMPCVITEVNCTQSNPCIESYCEAGVCIPTYICNTTTTTSTTGIPTTSTTGTSTTGTSSTSTTGTSTTGRPTTTTTSTISATTTTTTISSTIGPTVGPTHTPKPTTTPIPAQPTPKTLDKDCLRCEDLNCQASGKTCVYLVNELYKHSNCKENCCSHTPTCS